MRIPALQTEDVGDLSSRVHASPHKTTTLPHGTLPEVAPCTSDCPSRSNTEGNRGFLLLWGQTPFFNTLFKTVPKRTKHRSRRNRECSSRRWNLNVCLSTHSKSHSVHPQGPSFSSKAPGRWPCPCPLEKPLLAMGRPIPEKIHLATTPHCLPCPCIIRLGVAVVWSKSDPHLLQGKGAAPLDTELQGRALQQGLERTYPQGLCWHVPIQNPSVVAVASSTLESPSPLGPLWCGWRGRVTGKHPVNYIL